MKFLLLFLFSFSAYQVFAKNIKAFSIEQQSILFLGRHPNWKDFKINIPLINDTNELITHLKIRSTCGCLKGVLNKSSLRPAEQAIVSITMDTENKSGADIKVFEFTYRIGAKQFEIDRAFRTIISDKKLFEIHNKLTHQNIFAAKCINCHIAPANKLLGKNLYRSLCSQCHGPSARGLSAPGFNSQEFLTNNYNIEKMISSEIIPIHKFINNGAFSLNKKQVKSLVEYMKELKNKFNKENKLFEKEGQE